MFKTGLVSISFRSLRVEEILRLCVEAGMDGVEWGGDVHVPAGDLGRARAVKAQCEDADIDVAAYGSYYRLAAGDPDEFEAVLESARALDAPTIRVWAGTVPSEKADAGQWERVVSDALRCADKAQEAGLRLCYEYHGGTLTDSISSARTLLAKTPHPAIDSLWQPINGQSDATNIESAVSVLERLSNVHVFHWVFPDGEMTRRPLAEGRERWEAFFKVLASAKGARYALMEFVAGDTPEQFKADAATLHSWLEDWGLRAT